MNLNTYKHRNRYSTIVFVIVLLTMLSLLGLTIYVNFNSLKLLFTYKPPEQEIPIVEQQYNEILYKVQKLEELSFEYNKEDYQKRVLTYIRSERYNDEAWDMVAGSVDADFDLYVQEHQGDLKLDELKQIPTFPNPTTQDYNDFVHMAATLDTLINNDQEKSDMAGWAGDLYQLIVEFKDTALTGDDLKNAIRNTFNGDLSVFSKYDVCADMDAVNIYSLYQEAQEKSLFLVMRTYFNNLSAEQRIKDFRNNTFSAEGYNELKQEVFTRLNGTAIMPWFRLLYGIDTTAHEHVINACVEAFVDYIY